MRCKTCGEEFKRKTRIQYHPYLGTGDFWVDLKSRKNCLICVPFGTKPVPKPKPPKPKQPKPIKKKIYIICPICDKRVHIDRPSRITRVDSGPFCSHKCATTARHRSRKLEIPMPRAEVFYKDAD